MAAQIPLWRQGKSAFVRPLPVNFHRRSTHQTGRCQKTYR